MERSSGDDPLKGFFWLGITYVCGTIFYLTSKVLLSSLDRDVFIVWWYGLGMLCHIGYGLTQKSITIESIGPRERRFLAVYILFDLITTVAMFSAIKLMDPGVVSFITQAQVLIVLLFGYLFLGEKLFRREIMAAMVIIIGVVIMSYQSSQVPFAGGVLLIASNVCGAIVFIIVRHTCSTVGTLTLARLRTISLFTVFFILNIIRFGRIIIPSLPIIALTAAGTFFGPFLNTISIFKTIEYIPVGKVSLFRSIQPLFVAITALIFLGTFPGFRETAGGIIMIMGSALLAYFHTDQSKAAALSPRGFRG